MYERRNLRIRPSYTVDGLVAGTWDVEVKRGLRFVEGPKISTAGGLTSGIDLALRVGKRAQLLQVAPCHAYSRDFERRAKAPCG